MTTTAEKSGQYTLGDRSVHRIGYGAMQLAGPHVLGPPRDRDAAVAVLRRAVELGVDHIDTSDYYGPHVTNEIIREALHPYPEDLTIVTKIGARRTPEGDWPEALGAALGAATLTAGWGYTAPIWAGAAVAAGGVGIAVLTIRSERGEWSALAISRSARVDADVAAWQGVLAPVALPAVGAR